MVRVKTKGSFKKTEEYLKKRKKEQVRAILEKYGKKGVEFLRIYTPKDTGLTANSWYYVIEVLDDGRSFLRFNNRNIIDDVPIALILQYGHGTKNGGYVEGIDYINPALKRIYKNLADSLWEEVRK